jgi:hypothetical protein
MNDEGASGEMVRGSAVIDMGIERMTGKPAESVTRIVIVLLARFDGTPLKTPVVAFIESPRGTSPVADHL